MTERMKALLKLGVFFFLLFGAGSLATLYIASNRPSLEPSFWACRDNEAMQIIKRCKIPMTDGTILEFATGYFELAKAGGNFIEFEGWYAFQVSDSLYEAGVGYKVNGIRKTARWDVDLKKRKVKARNQEAFIFSGNNDLLSY